jgi:hypothetical protein
MNEIQALAEASAANHEAFEKVICKFHISVGQASSAKSALEGNLDVRIATGPGIWIKNGDQSRYELELPDEYLQERLEEAHKQPDVAGGNQGKSFSLPFAGLKFLTDERLQLNYSPLLDLCTVSKTNPSDGPTYTPLGRGAMGRHNLLTPTALIKRAVEQKRACRIIERFTERGVKSVVVEVELQPSADGTYQPLALIKFAVNRGCFPTEISRTAVGEPVYWRNVATDLIECSGGRWFPKRVVHIDSPDAESGPIPVREIVVDHIDADVEPSVTDLTVSVPAGAAVSDGQTPGSQFVAGNAFEVSPMRLASVLELAKKSAELSAQADVEAKTFETLGGQLSQFGDAATSDEWMWIVIANIPVACVVLVAWRIRLNL